MSVNAQALKFTAGSIVGEFNVTDQGSAAYTIPIKLAPGTAGLTPTLSVMYSSQGSNGLMGVGWSIMGFSQITVGDKTLAQDVIDTIKYFSNGKNNVGTKSLDGFPEDNQDRYYLDGERLVLAEEPVANGVFNKNYGKGLRSYYTEQFNFSRIDVKETYFDANGVDEAHPKSFEVKSKDGLLWQYGSDENSRLSLTENTEARTWLVRKINDTKGNYIQFNYIKNGGFEYYPESIEYTGNSITGLLPYNKVEFIYEQRPDINSRSDLDGDNTIVLFKRLKEIHVYCEGKLFKKYLFKYSQANINGYSLLTSITECDGVNTCFNPITFEYSDNNQIVFDRNTQLKFPNPLPSSGFVFPGNLDNQILQADWDNNGLTDFLMFNPTSKKYQFYIHESENDTIFPVNYANLDLSPFKDTKTLECYPYDVNTDGRSDLLMMDRDNGIYRLYINDVEYKAGYFFNFRNADISKFTIPKSLIQDKRFVPNFGDWNKDGITDMFFSNVTSYTQQPTFYFIKNKSFSSAGMPEVIESELRTVDELLPISGDFLFDFSDFNNDGLPDILGWDRNTKKLSICYKRSDTGAIFELEKSPFFAPEFNGNPYATGMICSDFTSDGKTDIFLFDVATGNNRLIIIQSLFVYTEYDNLIAPDFIKNSKGINAFDLNVNGFEDLLITTELTDGSPVIYHARDVFKKGGVFFLSGIQDKFISKKYPPFFGRYTKNGPVDILIYNYISNASSFYSFRGVNKNVLTKIVKGNGGTIELIYSDLLSRNDNNGEKNYAPFPTRSFRQGITTVRFATVSDGIGGKNTVKYEFIGPHFNLEGRGFRGFSRVIITDLTRNIATRKEFNFSSFGVKPAERDNYHRYLGAPLLYNETVNLDINTSQTGSSYDFYVNDYKTYFRASSFGFTKEIISVKEDIKNDDGIEGTPRTKRVQYDDYGNIVLEVIDYSEGQKDSIINTYVNDTGKWFLGRLKKSTVFFIKQGKSTIQRSSEFSYNPDNGLLVREFLYPDSSAIYQVSKEYTYDLYGNVVKSSEKTWNGFAQEERTIETTYDEKGRFAITTRNSLGQTESKVIDPRFGKPSKLVSPNGIANTMEYDNLGRCIKEIFPDGNWARVRYLRNTDTSNIPLLCKYIIVRESSNKPAEYQFLDELDRVIQSISIGFNGDRIIKKQSYDTRGYLINETEPYYENQANKTVILNYKYDYKGRVVEIIRPFKKSTATEKISYFARQKNIQNSIGHVKKEKYDTREKLVEVVDNANNILTFEYNAAGAIELTRDPAGNTSTYTYDFRGFNIAQDDPNIGVYRYRVNGFGETYLQISPSNDSTLLRYDKLGRLIERKQKEGVITFIYDTRPAGIGKLSSINGLNGYTYDLFYDKFGRISRERETIGGKVFNTDRTYDSAGRVSKIIYPGGLEIVFSFTKSGFLSTITRNSDKYVIWKAENITAKGQLEQFALGNLTTVKRFIDNNGDLLDSSVVKNSKGKYLQAFGYEFNSGGQLTKRSNRLRNVYEEFGYDDLNRMILSRLSTGDSVSLSYDELGNILHKSDVGEYTYGGRNNGPHQVREITQNGKVCLPGFQINTSYTTFNKISRIEKDSLKLEIFYNAFDRRCMQKLYIRDKLVKTKIYVGNSYEYTVTGDTVLEASFIRDFEGAVSVYYKNSKTGSNFHYLYKDHIGSTTLIVDSSGLLVNELSYDAWGKRRKADWSYSTDSSLQVMYQRGFTGHEHYDLFDIIDMNGRIYDPVLGRFLSPDPVITDIANLQNLNRYSYVLNNPLTLTDPSGYFFKKIKGLFTPIANVIKSAANLYIDAHKAIAKEAWKYRYEIAVVALIAVTGPGGAALATTMLSGALWGAGISAGVALLSGGNASDALKAGVRGAVYGALAAGVGGSIGAAFNGVPAEGMGKVGLEIFQSGLTNGSMEIIQGGSFEHGFMQGLKNGAMSYAAATATWGVGELGGHKTTMDNVLYKSVGHGIVQGISAQLSGGEFRDGFIVGATVSASQLLINNANPEYRVAISGLIGGTSSVISGGKFANGAASGMMIWLFNENGEGAMNSKDKDPFAGNPVNESFNKRIYLVPLDALRGIFGGFRKMKKGEATESLELMKDTNQAVEDDNN